MNAATKPCPICKKPRAQDFAPFCSQRCKDRDLARWFGDGYSVPGPPADPEDMMRDQSGGAQWNSED